MALQYTNEVIIRQPLAKVVALFTDPANAPKWIPNLISLVPISGEPGQVGSQCRMKINMGKKEVEMIETITKVDLPREFTGTYEAKGVWNEVQNFFEPIDAHTTRYHTHNEFRLSGVVWIFGCLMPGMFKKESQAFLDRFKAFAESQ